MEIIINLLQHSTIWPIVLVGYLQANFIGLTNKLDLTNALLECNSFVCRGLTVLMRKKGKKKLASCVPRTVQKTH